MTTIIEQMARAMLALRVASTDETWLRYRRDDSWKIFEEDARVSAAALRNSFAYPVVRAAIQAALDGT